jgi:hypothetical protein
LTLIPFQVLRPRRRLCPPHLHAQDRWCRPPP